MGKPADTDEPNYFLTEPSDSFMNSMLLHQYTEARFKVTFICLHDTECQARNQLVPFLKFFGRGSQVSRSICP